MGVILLLGRDDDILCQLVRQQLVESGREVFFVSEGNVLPGLRLIWQVQEEPATGRLAYQDWELAFADLDAVLFRFYGIPLPPEDYSSKDGQYISSEWNAMHMAWLEQLPCLVINRLRPELWYKPHLTVPDLVSLVPEIPFRLPRVLVTTRGADAVDFRRRATTAFDYSPLTQPARYPIRSDADIDKLSRLGELLPLYLVERIRGRAMRAYVLEREVVLVGSDGHLATPPQPTLGQACRTIAQQLGLSFLSLALVDAEGTWYCTGLDRMPHLFDCAPDAQQAIAARLAGLLQHTEGRRR